MFLFCCLAASLSLLAQCEADLDAAQPSVAKVVTSPLQMDFPFTNPDDGTEYVLSMRSAYVNGLPLRFAEQVFDFANSRPTPQVYGVPDADWRKIYRSDDLGLTWSLVASLSSSMELCFTTAAGTHLVRNNDTGELVRVTSNWVETPLREQPHYQWLGPRGIGQHGDTIMYAEYWVDESRPEGYVWRSRDDGRTWQVVFTAASHGSSAPAASQIRHFHTIQPDPYASGRWYLSSGDAGPGYSEDHVWITEDDGDTWTDVTDPAPAGLSLRSLHRLTGAVFTPEAILWPTDDLLAGNGPRLVRAVRGKPLDVEAVSRITTNHGRDFIQTDIGEFILTENSYDLVVPGFGYPGVEIGLFTTNNRFLRIGVLKDSHGYFASSRSSYAALGGAFVSQARWNTAGRPEKFVRWALTKAAIPLQAGVAGGGDVVVDLAAALPALAAGPTPPHVESSRDSVASVELEGLMLHLHPLRSGEARISVSGNGAAAAVRESFRVLVYPAAQSIAGDALKFNQWSPDAPEGTFPDNMLFLQSDTFDPGVDTPLQYAYSIPANDYSPVDVPNVGFPYRVGERSRISGLDSGGVSFVNAGGQQRDVGGALAAIDTRGAQKVNVKWAAETLSVRSADCRIRLQWRVGLTGAFHDVLDAGAAVEYGMDAGEGETMLGPVSLPAECEDQPYVQLLWRYYFVSGSGTDRPTLRLDNIRVRQHLRAGISGGDHVKAKLGGNHSFRAVTNGNLGTVSYQWSYAAAEGDPVPLTGETDRVLNLVDLDDSKSGRYMCEVRDDSDDVVTNSVDLEVVDDLPTGKMVSLALIAVFAAIGGVSARRRGGSALSH